jgi:hypothetical protein
MFWFFFLKTDSNGKYRLERLPTGTYTVKAWVNEKTIYSKTVDLKDGGTLKVDFSEK